MKTVLRALGVLVPLVLFVAGGAYLWASGAAAKSLGRTIDVHTVDFPIPFPLDPAEVEARGLTPEEADEAALAGALERGRHLVESRYACSDCHGEDFGGGVMVDAPIMGRLLGPNISTGAGSRAEGYTAADWDRIVRHGVRRDGRVSAMPSQDFQRMSDQELSDIVAYIRSRPPVDAEVPAVTLGPLGKVLVATGQIQLSADLIGSHFADHLPTPPAAEVSVEFGAHLAGTCTGCHGASFAGGKIPGGDPAWAPASDITQGGPGMGSWSYDEFVSVMREGRRPDGSELASPMSLVVPYTARMTPTELESLWMFLRSVPPAP